MVLSIDTGDPSSRWVACFFVLYSVSYIQPDREGVTFGTMRTKANVLNLNRLPDRRLGIALFLTLDAVFLSTVVTAQQVSRPKQTQMDQVHATVAARLRGREATLRKRAQDLYSLLQVGHWDQAESFVAPDTLDNFRKQAKSPFLGFEIQSVRVAPNGEGGVVLLNMRVVNTFSPGPTVMPQTSRWRWIKGDWYLEVPSPAEQGEGLKAMFNGRKGAQSTVASQPEDLKFKGHRFKLGMVHDSEVAVARFPFTNVTDHSVTLSGVDTFCDCLQAKTEKKEFKPGESGEIEIAFDPKGFEREYIQTILVKTEPGDLKTYLTITAFVVTAEEPTRKPGSRVKPGS